MNKNQKGFVAWLLIVAIVAVIAGIGGYVFYRHHQQSIALQKELASCNPCSDCPSQGGLTHIPGIVMTHESTNLDKQELETLIKPIHGKLSVYYNSVESNSDYHEISVPFGTETKAISYLKKQPQVIDAWQELASCPN